MALLFKLASFLSARVNTLSYILLIFGHSII